MRRIPVLALLLWTLLAPRVSAQPAAPGLIADLLRDIDDVESRIVGLVKAMPDKAWDWRPAAGVRSTAEVIAHVTADNYVFPVGLGIAAPASTGIDRLKSDTVQAFERRPRTRAQAMTDLAASFAFLEQQVGKTTEAQLADPIIVFGRPSTRRATWLEATTHLHEHLGQLIAYARSNDVTPPWSK